MPAGKWGRLVTAWELHLYPPGSFCSWTRCWGLSAALQQVCIFWFCVSPCLYDCVLLFVCIILWKEACRSWRFAVAVRGVTSKEWSGQRSISFIHVQGQDALSLVYFEFLLLHHAGPFENLSEDKIYGKWQGYQICIAHQTLIDASPKPWQL